MDEDITTWVLEFLLLQEEVSDATINQILINPDVPFNNQCPRLKKAAVLKSIDSEISSGSVSETILDLIECIEEINRVNKIKISDSMKDAYCAVALECSVKYLWGNTSKIGNVMFAKAVKRIWGDRVPKLVSKECELVSDELRKCEKDIEEVLSNADVYERLKRQNTRDDALRLTAAFIREARAIMGPSFLQRVARTQREATEKEASEASTDEDPEEKEAMELTVEKEDEELEDDYSGPIAVEELAAAASGQPTEEIQREMVLCVANITDNEDMNLETTFNHCNTLPTPEVKETLKSSSTEMQAAEEDPALHVADVAVAEMGSENLDHDTLIGKLKGIEANNLNQKATEARDELVPKQKEPAELTAEEDKELEDDHNVLGFDSIAVEGLGAAATGQPTEEIQRDVVICVAKITDDEDMNFETTLSQHNTLPTPVVKETLEMVKSSSTELQAAEEDPALHVADVVVAEMGSKNLDQDTLIGKQQGIEANNLNQEILVEKQSRGHVRPCIMECNTTACVYEWIDESSEAANRNIKLDTPKAKNASPLKEYEAPKFGKRRNIRKWSLKEEDALRQAVRKYGKGNWKAILNSEPDLFNGRNEVDIKDKWRNLMK